jgi:hypothetical protein
MASVFSLWVGLAITNRPVTGGPSSESTSHHAIFLYLGISQLYIPGRKEFYRKKLNEAIESLLR